MWTKSAEALDALTTHLNLFAEGLQWINAKCHEVRVREQDGIVFVRMNNDQTRLQRLAQDIEKRVQKINTLCQLMETGPNSVTNAQTLEKMAQEILVSIDAELRVLQSYLNTIKRYKS